MITFDELKSEALLRIDAPHFVAGAVFEERAGIWKCVMAAPIIGYLCKMTTKEIKRYLGYMGWKYEWVKVNER